MEPRPASTTVLVRPSPQGPELLFVRRPETMRLFGGFHAFPGGAVDESDFSREAAAAGTLTPADAEKMLGEAAGDRPATGYFVCALRELFEEVGVLYATREGQDVELFGAEVADLRHRLRADEIGIAQVAAALGVKLGTHRLKFLARWIAPELVPVRFDARFFVAHAAGELDPDPDEVSAMEWLTPVQAMTMAEAGALMLAPPTVATISSLSRFESTEEIFQEGAVTAVSNVVEVHSPLVRRIVAPNASIMTGPGSNTYIVGSEKLIVIDPGSMEPVHLVTIMSAGEIQTIIATHSHPDHLAGVVELAERTGAEVAVSSRFRFDLPGARRLDEGDTVEVGDVRLQVLDTPGHCSDHICLWLEEEKALFSGDLVLGEGTTVISPPDGNLIAYLDSLDKVARLEAARLYPGHFSPRDDAADWIEFYRRHRSEREEQVIEALAAGRSTPADIVSVVYGAYPPALHPVAERSVLAHLEKLVAEGRVSHRGEEFELSPTNGG